jgi:hypothetical protein
LLYKNLLFKTGGFYEIIDKKIANSNKLLAIVAGAVGLEPTTNGFGDHYSTN